MTIEDVKKEIRDIQDFPSKGIVFKDLTTVFKNAQYIQFLSDMLYNQYKDYGITKVIGIESRGFIMGAILSEKLNAGFIPVRKKGKLPAESYEMEYQLEYGSAIIEMHKDALDENDVVLIHDDLLATGGTLAASISLVKILGVKKIYCNTIVELTALHGRKLIESDVEFISLIKY
ncbi:MAG: adenine phosphoribosyltransferase [Prevotellaceae bacterium]|jgi:adenine phosphoribosyltransferase|nr:adenine phosphoribosyltransferase [Prevotellaceae bacterium]